MTIHPTAIIDPEAEIGPGANIGPFSYIGPKVKIGANCKIGPHVVIHPYTTIGDNCEIHAGAVLGDTPQDLSFHSDTESYVVIGNNCVFREGVTVHRGTKPGTTTTIGDDCFLMANSHCAHNVKLGNKVILVNGVLLAGYVEVDDGAFISGSVVVHQFVKIGKLAMLGGSSGIGRDILPYCTARSMALNDIAGLNVVGMRRAGITAEKRLEIKRAFRLIYNQGLTPRQAAAEIRQTFTSGPALDFSDFIDRSTRGICRKKIRGEISEE